MLDKIKYFHETLDKIEFWLISEKQEDSGLCEKLVIYVSNDCITSNVSHIFPYSVKTFKLAVDTFAITLLTIHIL